MKQQFDATRYADLLTDARRAFLADTSYAVAVAEAASQFETRREYREDPEKRRADVLRLHSQGASLSEIQRVTHLSRERIAEFLKDAPERAPEVPVTREIDARDRMPDPRPVIPAKKLKKWRPEPLADDDERHGSNTGYVNFRCRCDRCIEARKVYRAERKANPKPRAKVAEHGTKSRYSKGCRCPECKAAATEYARERAGN